MQNELTVDCIVSDIQCSVKAALLVSVKMLCNFLELLEIIRNPHTGSFCAPYGSCSQCNCSSGIQVFLSRKLLPY